MCGDGERAGSRAGGKGWGRALAGGGRRPWPGVATGRTLLAPKLAPDGWPPTTASCSLCCPCLHQLAPAYLPGPAHTHTHLAPAKVNTVSGRHTPHTTPRNHLRNRRVGIFTTFRRLRHTGSFHYNIMTFQNLRR